MSKKLLFSNVWIGVRNTLVAEFVCAKVAGFGF